MVLCTDTRPCQYRRHCYRCLHVKYIFHTFSIYLQISTHSLQVSPCQTTYSILSRSTFRFHHTRYRCLHVKLHIPYFLDLLSDFITLVTGVSMSKPHIPYFLDPPSDFITLVTGVSMSSYIFHTFEIRAKELA